MDTTSFWKVNDINEDIIQEAKENRAKSIQKRNHELAVRDWELGRTGRKTKPRGVDYAVDPDTIQKEDLIFRVMTFEHIPEEVRKKNPKLLRMFTVSVTSHRLSTIVMKMVNL